MWMLPFGCLDRLRYAQQPITDENCYEPSPALELASLAAPTNRQPVADYALHSLCILKFADKSGWILVLVCTATIIGLRLWRAGLDLAPVGAFWPPGIWRRRRLVPMSIAYLRAMMPRRSWLRSSKGIPFDGWDLPTFEGYERIFNSLWFGQDRI